MQRDPVCNMSVQEDDALRIESTDETYYFCSEGCRDIFLKTKGGGLKRTSYDLIIIGGGPAGLTAGVYAATLKIDAFLITGDLGGQAIDSTMIENYMGYDFITGPELIEKFKEQLIRSYYLGHLMSKVEKVEATAGGFDITTSELKKYSTKTLIVATGMTRRRLHVPGEEEFQRRGVFYGNIQDIGFVQGEDVAVVGGGNSALQIVENLHTVAKNIHLISTSRLSADPVIIERLGKFKNLHKYEGYNVTGFTGDSALSGVTIRKRAEKTEEGIPVKGVFVAIGLQPNSSIVSHLAGLNGKGEIIINPDCSTTHPGIFAAGDVTSAFGKRIIIASGEGAKAAIAARQYILGLRKK
ncbi:MAG: FAD-dependent oxidoreductase [Thermodesulfobacteriota bacterium]